MCTISPSQSIKNQTIAWCSKPVCQLLSFSSQPQTLDKSNNTFVVYLLSIFSTSNISAPPISIHQIDKNRLLRKLIPDKIHEAI